MLQIVIWMLCIYFIVKGFEILSNPSQRNALGILGAVLAWVAAPIFFLLSLQSVSPPSETLSKPAAATPIHDDQSFRDCLNDPNTTSC